MRACANIRQEAWRVLSRLADIRRAVLRGLARLANIRQRSFLEKCDSHSTHSHE
jgi:hypothetical protein